MSITLDDTTKAANPGGIKVSPVCYVRYYWPEMLGFATLYAFVIILAWYTSYWALVILLLLAFKQILEWIRIREHFLLGCVNPAVVIDPQRKLVAVFTNLTAVGTKPTPVIKVVRERLQCAPSGVILEGARLATVAVYSRDPESPTITRWSDFFPKVVDCFTHDQQACDRVRDSISPLAWTALKTGLAQLGPQPKEGLHRVDMPDDIAFNAY